MLVIKLLITVFILNIITLTHAVIASKYGLSSRYRPSASAPSPNVQRDTITKLDGSKTKYGLSSGYNKRSTGSTIPSGEQAAKDDSSTTVAESTSAPAGTGFGAKAAPVVAVAAKAPVVAVAAKVVPVVVETPVASVPVVVEAVVKPAPVKVEAAVEVKPVPAAVEVVPVVVEVAAPTPTPVVVAASVVTAAPVVVEVAAAPSVPPQETVVSVPIIEEPIPVVEVPLEVKLKQQIQEESKMREKRKGELNELESQLISSLKMKAEIEKVVSKEIASLRSRLILEIEKEADRVKSLSELYNTFNGALTLKNNAVTAEDLILSQMVDIRSKVKEEIIVIQLEAAILKKQDLLSIERSICKDIQMCTENLDIEIKETTAKFRNLKAVLETMPNAADTQGSREYTWDDVAFLQGSIVSSLESSVKRDEKVTTFMQTFDDAMRRRGLALGEPIDPAFIDFTSASTRSSSPSSKGTIATVTAAGASASAVKSTVPTVSAKRPAMASPSILELSEVLQSKSDEELSKTAIRSLTNGGDALLKVSLGLIGASAGYLNTKEAEESKVSVALAAESASSVFKSISNAWDAIVNSWDAYNQENLIVEGTTDEYVARVAKGVKAIAASKELKSAISDVSTNAKRSVTEVISAGSLTTSSLSKTLNDSNAFSEASGSLLDNISILASIGLVAVKRIVGQASKELPSTVDRKK